MQDEVEISSTTVTEISNGEYIISNPNNFESSYSLVNTGSNTLSSGTVNNSGGIEGGNDVTVTIGTPTLDQSLNAGSCEPNCSWCFTVGSINSQGTSVEVLNPEDVDSIDLVGGTLQDPQNTSNPNTYGTSQNIASPDSAEINFNLQKGKQLELRIIAASFDRVTIKEIIKTNPAVECTVLCDEISECKTSDGTVVDANDVTFN